MSIILNWNICRGRSSVKQAAADCYCFADFSTKSTGGVDR